MCVFDKMTANFKIFLYETDQNLLETIFMWVSASIYRRLEKIAVGAIFGGAGVLLRALLATPKFCEKLQVASARANRNTLCSARGKILYFAFSKRNRMVKRCGII